MLVQSTCALISHARETVKLYPSSLKEENIPKNAKDWERVLAIFYTIFYTSTQKKKSIIRVFLSTKREAYLL